MSSYIKFHTAFLVVIVTCITTGGYIAWLAGQKANDIEAAKVDILELRVDVGQLIKITERMDERSSSMASTLNSVESRLHGISTQVGQARREAIDAREN